MIVLRCRLTRGWRWRCLCGDFGYHDTEDAAWYHARRHRCGRRR